MWQWYAYTLKNIAAVSACLTHDTGLNRCLLEPLQFMAKKKWFMGVLEDEYSRMLNNNVKVLTKI